MTPGLTTLALRPGLDLPTTVFLADGSVVAPDEAGRLNVSWSDAQRLFAVGWIEVGGPYRAANQPGAMLTLDPTTGDVYQIGAVA